MLSKNIAAPLKVLILCYYVMEVVSTGRCHSPTSSTEDVGIVIILYTASRVSYRGGARDFPSPGLIPPPRNLQIFEYYDYLYSAISKNTLLLALALHSTDSIVSGFKGLRP